MSWETDNALKRIFNSFKRLKNQIFIQDIDALKLLDDYILEADRKRINDNQLFAKLLCFVLYRNVEHFKDIKQAIKSIQTEVFNGSMEEHIELLKLHLNKNDFDEYLKSLNLIHVEFTDEEDNENLEKLTKNQKEVIGKLKKFWNHDKVEKSFYNTANQMLNDINNYK